MRAKLICTLQPVMHRAMKEKKYSAVVRYAKGLMTLVGLADESKVKETLLKIKNL